MLKFFQADSLGHLAGFLFNTIYNCSCWPLKIYYTWRNHRSLLGLQKTLSSIMLRLSCFARLLSNVLACKRNSHHKPQSLVCFVSNKPFRRLINYRSFWTMVLLLRWKQQMSSFHLHSELDRCETPAVQRSECCAKTTPAWTNKLQWKANEWASARPFSIFNSNCP